MEYRRNYDRRERQEERPLNKERRLASRRRIVIGAGLLASLAAAAPRALNYSRQTSASQVADVEVSEDFRLPGLDAAMLDTVIRDAAATYGVSADLVKAVIQTESEFNPFAVSPVGALGLMQLMPVTAAYLGVADPFDPRQNVNGGVKYLSILLDRFNGNVALALAGYNAGPTAVARHRGIPPFRETRGYVQKIRALVADTHSAFSIPEPRRSKAKSRAVRRATHRRTVKTAALRSAAKGSPARSAVRKASVHRGSPSRVRAKARTASRTVRATRAR